MNKNVIYVSAFGVLCVVAGVLLGAGITKKVMLGGPCVERLNFAQRAEHFMGQGVSRHGAKKGGAGPLTMLTEKLALNEEQKTKIKDILEKTRQEITGVGQNLRNNIREIREKSDKQIMEILSPEQQEKFKALQKEFKKGRGPGRLKALRRPIMGHQQCPDQELPSQE